MSTPQSDLLQGTLDLLILKALTLQELHGMGISRRIAQITGGAFDVKAGSLFPALHRMEMSSWIKSEWKITDTGRKAKYYRLTPAGRKELEKAEKSFEQLVKGIRAIFRYA